MTAYPRQNLGERLRLTTAQAIAEFYDVLLPDPDPESMDIAQDLCEQYGLKLAKLGHAMAVESVENKRSLDTRNWATDFSRTYSTGQFILSESRDPWVVEMRPPKRGERGWFVEARTSRGALLEIVRESEAMGWIARRDESDKPDEHNMIAVTVKPNPRYMAVGWMVWSATPPRGAGRQSVPKNGAAFRVELWVAYRGHNWDESLSKATDSSGRSFGGVKGPVLSTLSGINAPFADLPAIADFDGGLTVKIAEARAIDLAWRVGKMLKIHAQVGSDAIDVISALRESFADVSGPPRSIVNPWEVQSEAGGHERFAREEDAEIEAEDLRRRGARGVELRRVPPSSRPMRSSRGNPSGAMTRDQAALAFMQVIREPGVESMKIADDIVLQYRLPLVELSEAGRTADSTRGAYVLSPAEVDAPIDMIEWEIEKISPPMYAYAKPMSPRWARGYKFTWQGRDEWLSVPSTSGPYMLTREAAERSAAADAWALARKMKQCQVDSEQLGRPMDWNDVLNELRRVLARSYKDPTAPEVYMVGSSTVGDRPKKKRTYLEARDDIWAELMRRRWTMSPTELKTPHATSPNGWLRLWFKPQGVHVSTAGNMRGQAVGSGPTWYGGATHTLGNARAIAYDLDIRAITPQQFLDEVKQRYPQAFEGDT